MKAWAAGLLLLLAACDGPRGMEPEPPRTYGAIEVVSTPVPLNPRQPSQTKLGQLTYAGGVELSTTSTDRLHGLSGIDVTADGKAFIAVTDFGDLIRGRLVLDGANRLKGVEDVTVEPLLDINGNTFGRKKRGDAEDVSFAVLEPKPESAFAVSFEQDHRVLAYVGADAPGEIIFKPLGLARRRSNTGMEGVAARCSGLTNGGSVWVGFEPGEISRPSSVIDKRRGRRDAIQPRGFALSGLANRDCARLFVLYRAYDPLHGFRAVISQAGARNASGEPLRLAMLSGPLSRGNMEGLAAVDISTPEAEIWRFYLVSDDGFDPRGPRTLLMAFDWTSPRQTKKAGVSAGP